MNDLDGVPTWDCQRILRAVDCPSATRHELCNALCPRDGIDEAINIIHFLATDHAADVAARDHQSLLISMNRFQKRVG